MNKNFVKSAFLTFLGQGLGKEQLGSKRKTRIWSNFKRSGQLKLNNRYVPKSPVRVPSQFLQCPDSSKLANQKPS